VPAWSRPELLIAAPAGIGAYTPAHHLWSAGSHVSLNAGQDVQQLAQRHHALAAKDGIVLYTYGRAGNPNKPNQEVGIDLHAASGNVNVQSQSAATHLTADKAVDVASTHGMVQITAPKHILLTAAGAAIRIQQGNITLSGPGKVEFKASMKVLEGGARATVTHPRLPSPFTLDLTTEYRIRCRFVDRATGKVSANHRFRLRSKSASLEGVTDLDGWSQTLQTPTGEFVEAWVAEFPIELEAISHGDLI
jgi:uncharacterized protein (DUF2345 family)